MNLSIFSHERSPGQHSKLRRGAVLLALGPVGVLALGACSDDNEPKTQSTGAQLDSIIATELQEGPQLMEGDQILSVEPMGDNPTVQGIIREVAEGVSTAASPDTNAGHKASEASAAAIMGDVERTTGHSILSEQQIITTWLDCNPGLVQLSEVRCVVLATLASDGYSVE